MRILYSYDHVLYCKKFHIPNAIYIICLFLGWEGEKQWPVTGFADVIGVPFVMASTRVSLHPDQAQNFEKRIKNTVKGLYSLRVYVLRVALKGGSQK